MLLCLVKHDRVNAGSNSVFGDAHHESDFRLNSVHLRCSHSLSRTASAKRETGLFQNLVDRNGFVQV